MPVEMQPFEDSHPHLREFKKFLDLLNKESERGAVLIAAAMIDDFLERSILAFLVEHQDTKKLIEGFNAPIGTLSARTLAAFALGLLSESEYRECERVRKIRNVFAHNVHSSFKDEALRAMCANLHYSAKDYADVHMDAKGQFTTASVSLILNLTNRPHYSAQRRLQATLWPY